MVWGPVFEVDPLWPKPLPNHWLLGTTIGVSVDNRDHIWIIHRGDSLAAGEVPAAQDPPVAAGVLLPRAARARVRPGRHPRQLLGRPRRRLRVAGLEPRHLRRPHGQRVDRRQRRPRLASPEVHPPRQLPDAGRPLGRQRRQQRHRELRPAWPRYSWTRRTTRRTSPTAISTSGSSCSTPRPAPSSASGAPTATRPTTPTSAATTRTPSPRSSSARRCIAPSCRTTASSTSATGGTTASRCSRRTARSSKSCSWPKTPWGPVRPGTSRFSRDADQKYLYMADGVNEKVYIIDRAEMEVLSSFGDGGRQPGQFYGAHSIMTDSHGNILHDRDVRGQARAEVRLQGRRSDPRRRPGRRLAVRLIPVAGTR